MVAPHRSTYNCAHTNPADRICCRKLEYCTTSLNRERQALRHVFEELVRTRSQLGRTALENY
ncbi:MAG: hypothetical protein ABSH24_27665 [Bryobacteraceae bacterium]